MMQMLIRSKLMKFGGPGYAAPEEGSFPTMDETIPMILELGAVPTAAWLDGLSPAEEDPGAFQGRDDLSEKVPDTWIAFKRFKSGILRKRKEELERLFIEKLLIRNNGNISLSARNAGIDRRQFQDMIKALGIDTSLFRRADR